MHQRRRDVGFFNRRMNVLSTTAANAINEVRVVVTRTLTVWPWFGLIRKPSLVCVVSIDGEIAVRSVESVANGVGLCVFWPQGLCGLRLFVWSGAESRGGHSTGPVSIGAYLRLVIGDPVADTHTGKPTPKPHRAISISWMAWLPTSPFPVSQIQCQL